MAAIAPWALTIALTLMLTPIYARAYAMAAKRHRHGLCLRALMLVMIVPLITLFAWVAARRRRESVAAWSDRMLGRDTRGGQPSA